MNLYSFITPSDAINFKAENDKVAFAAAVILGNGKAGCKRDENGKEINLHTMLMFYNTEQIESTIKEQLGGVTIEEFLDNNYKAIAEAFDSFRYSRSESDRNRIDEEYNNISDPNEKLEWKKRHEDEERSSLTKWVQSAWNYANAIDKKYNKN